MNAAELIEKLRKVDPDTIVAVDTETGHSGNVNVYEVTRHVDRRPEWDSYVGDHPNLEPQEQVVLITHWGVDDGREL